MASAETGSASTEPTAPSEEFYAGPWRRGQIGIQLAHEQFTVPQLVELGAAAEKAGFDFLEASDHWQPWQANEAHSGQASVQAKRSTKRENK